MLSFDEATYLSLLFRFISLQRLSNCLLGSDVLLFSEFINTVSILFNNFIELIILLYNFSLFSLGRYKEYVMFLISFNKFSDVFPAFSYASAIGSL